MNVRSYPCRAAAAIAAAALLVCTSKPAEAATVANAASASQAVGSGTWGAVASQSTAAPYGSGPLTLTFTNTGSSGNPSFKSQYFTVGNTGTLPITAANYTGATAAQSSVRFIIESCSGIWNETNDTCSGGTATVLTTAFGTSTITPVAGPAPATSATAGIRLRARVNTNGSVPNNNPTQTLSLSITVDRTQVRTATTTGS